MSRRAIGQAALPDCPKTRNPGKKSGLMNQERFIQRHQQDWDSLELWLNDRLLKKTPGGDDFDFPYRYRQVCHHLAQARSRMYSQPLIERLSQLALRGHQYMYRQRAPGWQPIIRFFSSGFPSLVRREWRLVCLSAMLFFGSFFGMIIAIQINPELVYSVASQAQVEEFEAMYDPGKRSHLGRLREADSDILMFGFYIKNNTSIGFQTFAAGLLFGIGTVFFLLFNGIFIGTVAGHLTQLGYISTFWGFVAGHSAMELTAIVLAGAAGLKLGEALIYPRRKSRLHALRCNARVAVRIIYGAAIMFFIAAFIEAFWSSIAWLPVWIKYTAGLLLWALLGGYFFLQGEHASPHFSPGGPVN